MVENKFIYLVYLLFLCYTVFCINMKKNDVLKIDILKYKNEEDCPDFSNGYDNINKHCTFRFFCRQDDCSSVDNNGYVQFTNNEGKIEKLNTNICITGNESESPFCFDDKPTCNSNSDCFTNNCSNSTCIINNNAPIIECLDNYYYKSLFLKYKGEIHCGLGQYEKCNKNDDCASKSCGDGNHGDICVNVRWDRSNDKKNDIITKLLILISLLIAIIGSCLFSQNKKHKKEMKNNNNKV